MAKQLVNPIERHIEKVVLGVTGLLLLGAMAKYLVTSPNKVELGAAGVVTAKTVDEKVSQKSEVARQALREAKPKAEPIEPLADDFAKAATPLSQIGLGTELAASLSIGPDIPLIDTTGVTAERIKLVEVGGVPKPQWTAGRMLTIDPKAEGGEAQVPTDWVTVSTVFDLAAQSDLQLRTYGSKWRDVVLAPAELQRRERRPDMTWSDEDWKNVDAWPAGSLPEPPTIPLVADGKNIIVPKDDYRGIEKFFELISRPALQLVYLRPLPPPAVTTPTWRFPVITSLRDVAEQDDYYLFPEAAKAPTPRLVRYDWLDDAPAPVTPGTPKPNVGNPKDAIKEKFAEYDKHMKAARDTKDSREAIHAYNRCIEIQASTFATKDEKNRAVRLANEAEQLRKDLMLNAGTGGTPAPNAPDPKTAVKRDPDPKQQVWVHDARPGSLEGGKSYQYRMRMSVLNRLAGVPEKFQKPADAQTMYLHGPWSEPTDPVTIEPATQFYLDGVDRPKNEATLEVYQWFRGVWVTHRFKLKPGSIIDDSQRKPIPDPEDPTKPYNALVPFAADVVLADVEFDRRTRERKADKNGVRFLPPEPGGSVVTMDASGNLREYVEGFDKGDPGRKVMKDRVWKPPVKKSN